MRVNILYESTCPIVSLQIMDLIKDNNDNVLNIEAFHPGGFLLEEITECGLLKKDVANALGILPHHLSEIFAGKRNISAKLTVKLEKLLGINASY